MTTADRYRAKALELLANADSEAADSQIRTEFENLAVAFLRLAEQAERNAVLIIEFELPPENESDTKPKPYVRYWPIADIAGCGAHVWF